MAPARSSRAANDKLTTAGSSSQRVMQCWLDLVPEESDQKGEITVCFLILIGWSGIPWHVHVPLDQTGQCPSCKTPRHLSRQFAERASFSFCQCLHQVSLEACSNNSGKSSARTMLSSGHSVHVPGATHRSCACARRGSPSFWQQLFGYQVRYLCIMPSATTQTKVPTQQADAPFLLDQCFVPIDWENV